MSESTTTLAVFGDPNTDCWAVLVGGDQARLAFAQFDDADADPDWFDVRVSADDGNAWLVTSPGAGIDLRLELTDASTHSHPEGGALNPCRLSGTATVRGGTELDLPGTLLTSLPQGNVDSLRIVGNWFGGEHEISLLSIRPAGSKGHDADQVNVVARGEAHKLVFDPRLSTTYGPDGHPRKTGIELWLGDDEDAEQHPCRVSGVASGAAISAVVDDFSLRAYALRCTYHANAGTGVYVLAKPA